MKLLFKLIFGLSAISCAAQEVSIPESVSRAMVFKSVNVIPMDAERVLLNQVVVVRNGKIVAMGNEDKIKYNKNAIVIDGKGKYLMPGLAEMHAHVPPIDELEPMKEVLLLFAANGVTTIRGMLGHPRHLELRSKIQSGEILGPRFITSGPSFSGNSVPTIEAGAEMVRQQKKAGYDFLKLHPGLTKEKFAAIEKTAKEVNIPFAGHVSFDVGVWRAIDAGYATIDHMDGMVESLVPGIENTNEQENGLFGMFLAEKADTTKIQKLVTALRDRPIWIVPTQSLAERWFGPAKDADALANEPEMKYMDPKTVANWVNTKKNLVKNAKYSSASIQNFIDLRRKLIFECNKNGVGLLLGSDAPQVFDVPGFSVHQELKYLVDAGLTPFDALRSGTASVGRFLNNPDIGIIKIGAVADLVLLNGNPLTNIDETKNIAGVMLANKWLSKDWIEKELKKLEKK
ncbi:amidohydrolase family protein [Segetibacter sp.]|uniref:amidohydrolase family protein n=1 Tax=Segetibacter sp. TaxID=2231182 RepID=UPI00261FF3F6|nr:amidohydrolase family protein [Segetibacter sp.]MCW3080904.1 amidohydrolase [Segetibacter sp.]